MLISCVLASALPVHEREEAILSIESSECILAAASEFLQQESDESDLKISVDEGGVVVTSSPRIRLIDRLGTIMEKLGRERFAEWSRTELGRTGNVDERIIQLRNLSWADSGSHSMISEELRSLLRRGTGLTRFAREQAMDGVVYLRDAECVPLLAKAVEVPETEVLAAQTLDRLAANAPLGVMQMLNRDTALLSNRPLLRADFFAKADLSDTFQRGEVERYLRNSEVPISAQRKTIQGLIQTGTILSVGIFTARTPLPYETPRRREEALRKTFRAWLARNFFPHLQDTIREGLEFLEPPSSE